MVRPKLVADGMFLVGLDIVGDKLMEVNVFSPGGLGSCQSCTSVDFAQPSSTPWNARSNSARSADHTWTTPASPPSERGT